MEKSRTKRRKKGKGRKRLEQETATKMTEPPSVLSADGAQPLDEPAVEARDKPDVVVPAGGVAVSKAPVAPPSAVVSPSRPPALSEPQSLLKGAELSSTILSRPGATSVRSPKSPCSGPQVDPDTECGFFCVRSAFLDRFRTVQWALFFLCCISFLRNFSVGGIMFVVLPSLERRYQLTGSETGAIVSSNDLASSLLMLPVCFLASNRNQPNFVGGGIALVSAGNLVISMAHFLAPPYKPGGGAGGDETCPKLYLDDSADSKKGNVRHFRFVLMFGQILAGIGTTPVHTVSVAYLVDNMPPEKAPVYVGLFNSMSVFGPSLGFIIGGLTLKYYVDILTDYKALGITSSSGSWVGAWWPGFLVSAVLGMVLALIMVMFPKHLPGRDELDQDRNVILSIHTATPVHSHDFGDRLSGLPPALLKLCKNLTLDYICLARSFSQMYVTGITTVLTKFLEAQFALTSSKAALLIGPLVLVAGVGGAIAGGVLVTKLKLGCTGVLRLCIVNSFFSVLSILLFWWGCPDTNLAINANYKNEAKTTSSQYDLPCNSHCGCSEDVVQLVCSAENQLFLSPCYAGCQVVVAGHNITGYIQCDCIKEKMSMHGRDATVQVEAVRSRCGNDCRLLVPYLAAIVFSLTSVFLSLAPSTAVAIQVVKPKERALALGLLGLLTQLIGSMPAPMVFGAIVDSTCAAWNKRGGHRGNCVSYRNIDLAHGVFFTLLVCILACIAAYGGALYKVSKMKGGTEKDDDE
ncbi:solute carrier organic anion transporter family member 4A1-like isoform X2 [Ornithodoros turicata]